MDNQAEYNFTIYKGDDFSKTFTFTDSSDVAIDLSGYSVASDIREKNSSDSSLIVAFTAALTGTPTDGVVTLTLSDTQTAAITNHHGHYDLVLTNGSAFSQTYVYGKITFKDTVTEV